MAVVASPRDDQPGEPGDPSAPPGSPGSTTVQPAGPAGRFVEGYLATLGATSPSTQRQRTWALRELLAHPGASSPAALLTPTHVRSWLDAAATADPPASLPGLRARASAARALAQHGERTAALPAGTSDALAPVLRMPAPPLAPGPDPDPVRRLLVAAHPDARPLAVHPAVWTRFCAHVHLLALTGEREDVMATLRVEDVAAGPTLDNSHTSHAEPPVRSSPSGPVRSTAVEPGSHIDGDAVTPPLFSDAGGDDAAEEADEAPLGAGEVWPPEGPADADADRDPGTGPLPGAAVAAVAGTHVRIQTGLSPRSWRLGEPARAAVSGWLADRALLAALLRGSDPAALWLRVRPSTDLRTGALRPAGLPVSDRGLRLAFTTTLAVLALEDRSLADLSTAAVRAYARGRGPA